MVRAVGEVGMADSRGSSPVRGGGVLVPQVPQAPTRSAWLGFIPVAALEDTVSKVQVEAEEAVEAGAECLAGLHLPLAFALARHTQAIAGEEQAAQTWRMRERMKTVSVALVICLNVGVDPPDVTKTEPCARQECWVDPR